MEMSNRKKINMTPLGRDFFFVFIYLTRSKIGLRKILILLFYLFYVLESIFVLFEPYVHFHSFS